MTKQNEKIKKALQTILSADGLFFDVMMLDGVCPKGLGMTGRYENQCNAENKRVLCPACWRAALEVSK